MSIIFLHILHVHVNTCNRFNGHGEVKLESVNSLANFSASKVCRLDRDACKQKEGNVPLISADARGGGRLCDKPTKRLEVVNYLQ